MRGRSGESFISPDVQREQITHWLGRLHFQVMRFGGPYWWGPRFGIEIPERFLIWTEERVRGALRPFLRGREVFPSSVEFVEAGLASLRTAADSYGGGAEYWADEFGLAYKSQSRTWPKEKIRKQLDGFLAGREHFPTNKEFREAGMLGYSTRSGETADRLTGSGDSRSSRRSGANINHPRGQCLRTSWLGGGGSRYFGAVVAGACRGALRARVVALAKPEISAAQCAITMPAALDGSGTWHRFCLSRIVEGRAEMEPTTPEQVSVEFAEAISAGDPDGAAGCFAEQASVLMADGGLVEGRAAIREILELLSAKRPKISVEIERMIESPAGAVGSARWTLSFGGEGKESGCSTVVFDNVGDGWEILVAAPWGLVPTGHPQEVDDLAAVARRALAAGQQPLDQLLAEEGIDRAGGLFAIYAGADAWQMLGLGEPPDGRPLYVGKAAGEFPSRSLKTYAERAFLAQRARDFSLRRSFAALLVDDLRLIAIPRLSEGGSERRWKLFALEEDGDRRLTEWMRANLRVAIWVSPAGAPLEEVRAVVREAWLPPLNLMEVVTPWSVQLRAARAKLAKQAKGRMEEKASGAEIPER